MKIEDIKKASVNAIHKNYGCNGQYPCTERNYCIFCNGNNTAFDCCDECGADEFNEGFIAGAEWRINSVWHDANEKPKIGELIIVEVYGKIWDYGKYDICDTIHPKARWAYIKDLLPNTEE